MSDIYGSVGERVEQARAIVSGEVWHDRQLATLLELALERLEELKHDHESRLGTNVIAFRRGNRTPLSASASDGQLPADAG